MANKTRRRKSIKKQKAERLLLKQNKAARDMVGSVKNHRPVEMDPAGCNWVKCPITKKVKGQKVVEWVTKGDGPYLDAIKRIYKKLDELCLMNNANEHMHAKRGYDLRKQYTLWLIEKFREVSSRAKDVDPDLTQELDEFRRFEIAETAKAFADVLEDLTGLDARTLSIIIAPPKEG